MKGPLKLIIGFFLLINFMIFGFLFYPVPDHLEQLQTSESLKILDRDQKLLYEVLEENTGRKSPIPFERIPDEVKQAFLAIEDQRFYQHGGVDLKAILRAIWQNWSAGEVVSGGSTITQQVVRNLVGIHKKRTIPQKIKESIVAIKITRLHSKDDIFEMYLNSIYFGGLAYGVEAASWQYFNKSIMNADLAEAAFLAGLPQAPNRYYPFKHFERAKNRQQEVLKAMWSAGYIDADEANRALSESLNLQSEKNIKKAPHFVDYILSQDELPLSKTLVTTLDLGLQERVENILAGDLSFLTSRNIENAAAVILNAKTGEILAMAGSADYDNAGIQGKVNVTTSLRQPGSSLKPLIYALALEKGWTPQTIIEDEPVRFETAEGLPYSPKNFDLKYRGKVSLAEALAQSLNIPAVKAMDFIGLSHFLTRARDFGLSTLNQSPEHYGLSLALGSGEVKLLELASAYSAFANRGQRPDPVFLKNQTPEKRRVIQEQTASYISSILSSNSLRTPAFGEANPLHLPFKVAAKTGTTRNFRDNWTIGYTDDYVVGVWVGNARGEVMQGVSGITGAGPIFYKIMNLLHEMTNTRLTAKEWINAKEAENEIDLEFKPKEFRIISPFANDVFLFDPTKPNGFQRIQLKSSQQAKWYINDVFLAEAAEVLWPLKRGRHVVKAVNGTEQRKVHIEVK